MTNIATTNAPIHAPILQIGFFTGLPLNAFTNATVVITGPEARTRSRNAERFIPHIIPAQAAEMITADMTPQTTPAIRSIHFFIFFHPFLLYLARL